MTDELRERVIRSLWRREPIHLHLVELMHALESARIAPCRRTLATEAGRVSDILQWQLIRIQNFVTMQIGDRHLCCRHEKQIVFRIVIHRVAELRQMRRTERRFLLHKIRRQHFGVTVFARMHVNEPIDERALQTRAPTFQHVTARAVNLDATLKVHETQRGAQVPMWQRREIELRHCADDRVNDVVRFVGPDRHAVVR